MKVINPVDSVVSNTYKQIVMNIKTVASLPFFDTSIGLLVNKTNIPPSKTNNSRAIRLWKNISGNKFLSQTTKRIKTVLSTNGSRITPRSLTILYLLATIPSRESLNPIMAISITSKYVLNSKGA